MSDPIIQFQRSNNLELIICSYDYRYMYDGTFALVFIKEMLMLAV